MMQFPLQLKKNMNSFITKKKKKAMCRPSESLMSRTLECFRIFKTNRDKTNQ